MGALNGAAVTEQDATSHFTDAFLARVSAAEFVATLTSQLVIQGPYRVEGVEGTPTELHAVILLGGTGQTRWKLSVTIDPATSRIGTINVRPTTPTSTANTWPEVDQQLSASAASVSVFAGAVEETACTPAHTIAPDERRPIASVAKLYVLGALLDAITAGTASWDEQLTVDERYKSLPSGVTQNDPAGTRRSIAELATRMISSSDNTAADHLIARLGRGAVEQAQTEFGHQTAANAPFLTTRELFQLKLGPPDVLAAFGSADEPRRRQIVDQLGAQPLPAASNWTTPRAIDNVGWFASASDLCRTMVQLRDKSADPALQPLSSVVTSNSGIPLDPAQWRAVWFKGGYEPGVLTFAWLAQRADERWFSLVVLLSDTTKPVDDHTILGTIAGAFTILAATP